jgi:Mrp family chromosome partitioning ATPase
MTTRQDSSQDGPGGADGVPAGETTAPATVVTGVVYVAHRFPMRVAPHRDPSTYLLSPTRLLSHHPLDLRSLRVRIEQRLPRPAVLLMASARHGEGRSIAALHLSIAFTQGIARVAYVEADFRRPALHTFFELPASNGLADLLRGTGPMGDANACMLPTDVTGLYLLPAGVRSGSSDAHLLLQSPRLSALLAWLRGEADWTIIDAAPLLTYADALPLLGQVDGVVVIAREGRTRDKDLASLSARLARTGAPILETVHMEC